MKISITDLKEKIHSYLRNIDVDDDNAVLLTELVIEQLLVGNQFNPLDELSHKASHIQFKATEEVIVDKPSAQLIKGNGKYAPFITADHLSEAIGRAKTQGIYALGIYDSTYNDFFAVFCRRIASENCIGIIVENGGPQGVVPFGGKKDVTGTNPIAYGIPTHDNPIVFDAATAMHAYGRIKQAKEKGELLPDNAFVDEDGNVTTDPNIAYAVLPFGGFKGFAINLLIDVLSGSLVRGKSGLDQPLDSQRFIGTFIIIIDPSCFGDLGIFLDSTTKLVKDILAVPAINEGFPVRVPGIIGGKRMQDLTQLGSIDIDDEVWERFSSGL